MRTEEQKLLEKIRFELGVNEDADIIGHIVGLTNDVSKIASQMKERESEHSQAIRELKEEHQEEIEGMRGETDEDELAAVVRSEVLDEVLALIGIAEGDFDTVTLDLRHNPIKFLVNQLRTLAPYALADDYKTKSVREVWAAPVNAPKVRRVRKVKVGT